MRIEEYKDGLAFCQDDGITEIAFYSYITDRISYSKYNGYKDWIAIGCVEIPYEDVKFMLDTIRKKKEK